MEKAEREQKSTPLLYVLFGPPPAPDEEVLDRYSKPVRILHWVNAAAWVVLFITGLVFFVPQFGGGAVGGWSGLFHRIAAVVMVGWALLYAVADPRSALRGIKDALRWGKDDARWLLAAPAYYFLGKEESTVRVGRAARKVEMPPQEHINTGQKLWWLLVLGGGGVMVITGALMWFFKDLISPGA
ncbi:MAG: cytochrome b/b6 domain-containing protein, partial [Chloroflexota bacterium]